MTKSGRKIGIALLIGCFLIPWVASAQAEEESASTPVPAPTQRPVKSPKRGKRREQKETEGTEAPERFEADTILKSPYSIEGQQLEVDPD